MTASTCSDLKAAGFPVTAACEAAGVSTSGYYDRCAREAAGPTERQRAEAELVELMRAIFEGPDGYVIPDLVGRRFDPGRPDVAWAQDITYIPTQEGWLFLASVLDLGSRRLLGYSMADHMRSELVLDALGMAIPARGGDSAVHGVIVHADRGSQYTSNDYLDFCLDRCRQLRPSVGRTGVCWDCDDPRVLLRSA